jgi:hypothetical protein
VSGTPLIVPRASPPNTPHLIAHDNGIPLIILILILILVVVIILLAFLLLVLLIILAHISIPT